MAMLESFRETTKEASLTSMATIITTCKKEICPRQRSLMETRCFEALLASLVFKNMGVRLRNVGPALSNTCQWLRGHESFVFWLNDDRISATRGLLWIKGKSGCGKSTIMRETLLWMRREHPQQNVVSYFFDARSPIRLAESTIGMYQSILHQILRLRREIHRIFMDDFRFKINDQGSDSPQIEDWSETEIQNFLVNLADTQNLSALTIFIDVLDEDDGDDVQETIGFFEDLQQRVAPSGGALRICLSSRHYPYITIRSEPIILKEQLGHGEDISEYLRTRFLGEDSLEKSELQERIMKKAAGIFLWVVLVIHMLNREYKKGKGLASMYRELDRAPEKVQELFKAILARKNGNKEECITLLRWVLFTERPLRPSELYVVVRHIRPTDMNLKPMCFDYDRREASKYLLYCSRGLVELTKANPSTVQFIHETVRELLVNTSILEGHASALAATLHTNSVVQAQVCHAMIADFCLAYLCDLLETKQTWGVNYHMEDYAVNHCWQHLESTCGSYRSSSVELASQLFTQYVKATFRRKRTRVS